MRKTTYSIILTLLCLSLSACGTIAESKSSTEGTTFEETTETTTTNVTTESTTAEGTVTATTSDKTEETAADISEDTATTESTDTTDASNTNTDIAPYKSVLDSIYDLVSGADVEVAADDDTIGLIESSTGNITEALSNIGYCTPDLNEDGRNELLIIDNRDADNRILDIYSLDENDKPTFLVGGWARNKYYLTDNNYIVNIGSSGADSTAYMIYRYSSDTNSLVPIECYFTDYKDESMEQLGWYHNTIGTLNKTESEWLGNIYDDALTAEIENKYTNYASLNLVYFKDYQK